VREESSGGGGGGSLTKAVVVPLVLGDLTGAEVLSRHHAAGGEDAEELVEERVFRSHCAIKRDSQSFGGAATRESAREGREGGAAPDVQVDTNSIGSGDQWNELLL
jgi:hypothetical protein